MRLRAVVEQEIEQLRAHRGQDLIGEQEEDEARREYDTRRRSCDLWRALRTGRPRLGEASLGCEQEADERELRDRRGEQQVLGRPEQGEQRDAKEAAEQESHGEAGHDARKPLLEHAHVEEPSCLSADEHEPHLERDREQDEEERRNPGTARHEDRPGRGVEDGEGDEARRRDPNESRSPRRARDER